MGFTQDRPVAEHRRIRVAELISELRICLACVSEPPRLVVVTKNIVVSDANSDLPVAQTEGVFQVEKNGCCMGKIGYFPAVDEIPGCYKAIHWAHLGLH